MGFESGAYANETRNRPSNLDLSSFLQSVKNGIQIGIVKDIILNEDFKNIDKYGGVNSIGSIFFNINNFKNFSTSLARPFFPQMSSFPLVNEYVLIFELPSTSIGENETETTYYYINAVNLWNHPHHNAYPDLNDGIDDEQQIEDYQTTLEFNVPTRKIKDGSSEVNLNSPTNLSQFTFFERPNIHPLQPFAGDVIHQGRWGNSIRFGSTSNPNYASSPQFEVRNNWSNVGDNGDPITMIRNGQSLAANDEGWTPITEDINNDLSSIYLTSNQLIPIATSSSFASYTPRDKEIPTKPSDYTGNQIILNSGRLVFNTNVDHIMLSSQRTISFNAKRGFNFDTPSNFVIEAGTVVKLGSKEAKEPLVKGDSLYQDLDFMLAALIQLIGIIEYSNLYPGGMPVPDGATSTTASGTKEALKNIKSNLKRILSKKVKTI